VGAAAGFTDPLMRSGTPREGKKNGTSTNLHGPTQNDPKLAMFIKVAAFS